MIKDGFLFYNSSFKRIMIISPFKKLGILNIKCNQRWCVMSFWNKLGKIAGVIIETAPGIIETRGCKGQRTASKAS